MANNILTQLGFKDFVSVEATLTGEALMEQEIKQDVRKMSLDEILKELKGRDDGK